MSSPLLAGSLAQARCSKECGDTVAKLQKKNQELQRHLEKACRQLQHSVREHQAAVQLLKGAPPNTSVTCRPSLFTDRLFTHPCVLAEEHESSLEKTKEEHRQQLQHVKRAEEASGFVSSVTSTIGNF